VEAAYFSKDGATLFVKALQQGFDEEKIRQILTGA